MNSLKVPESGLQLEGSTGKDATLPSQAFALTLSDFVIEDMIKSFQNGESINLSLGSKPTLIYGSNSHVISPPPDSNPYDLYLTRPFESTRTAEKIPHPGSLFQKPRGATSSSKAQVEKNIDAKPKTAKSSKSTASSGLESDIEALQNGLAAHAASREKSVSLGSQFGLIILTFVEGLAWLTAYRRRKDPSRSRASYLPDTARLHGLFLNRLARLR